MDDILSLCAGLPERSFESGQELLAEGGRSGEIHVLVDGVVGIEVGGIQVSRVSEPGAFLGEISALLGATHSARVVALTACRTKVMPAAQATTNPDLLLGMARLLAARLQAMTGYLGDLRHQYADSDTHLGLMADVLSELTAARPTRVPPGSTRPDQPDY